MSDDNDDDSSGGGGKDDGKLRKTHYFRKSGTLIFEQRKEKHRKQITHRYQISDYILQKRGSFSFEIFSLADFKTNTNIRFRFALLALSVRRSLCERCRFYPEMNTEFSSFFSLFVCVGTVSFFILLSNRIHLSKQNLLRFKNIDISE